MKMQSLRGLSRGLAPAALILGLCCGVQTANAAGFLWISAPNWSYSAAAAADSSGSVYFWAVSQGAGTFTWAGAFATDAFGSAAAFAEAAAGIGGVGAVQVAGIADPYAGVGIDYGSLFDPSNSGNYPTSAPGSNPFNGDPSYTTSTGGVSLNNEYDEQLNALDGLQAFIYTGQDDNLSDLETSLGLSGNDGSTSAGDYSNIGGLGGLMTSDTLIPLDNLITDPGDISSFSFTENTGDESQGQIILIGEGEAASTPEPASMALIGIGMLGLGMVTRRRRNS